jgi:lipoprotein-anchoring transpeptidase ErfK/SrfK
MRCVRPRSWFSVLIFLAVMADSAIANAQHSRAGARGGRHARTEVSPRWLAAQVALDRAGFSSGEIDGRPGTNTTRAVQGFQAAHNLPPSGQLDDPTIAALGDPFQSPTTPYVVADADMAGPFVPSLPKDMMQLATLDQLGYTSPLELLAERFHAQPALIEHLNPGVELAAGATLQVPNVEPFLVPAVRKAPVPQLDAATARVRVDEATKTVRVEAPDGSIAFQAPVSIGSAQDPLPKGEWRIAGTAILPVFQYNPALFWDADPNHAKAKVAAGPNNPVGVVWIDLDKEHMGFHGTPEPATIGRAQSHGCLRLTNWDAMRMASLVGRGTSVILQ